MDSKILIAIGLSAWIGVIAFASGSLSVGLLFTGVFLAIGFIGKVLVSVAEDWLEGREARKQREEGEACVRRKGESDPES
jgi:membrane protein implicated in regulation of membrane protease activity